MIALAFALAAVLAPGDDLARVQDAMHLYDRSHALVDREVGSTQATNIVTRLLDDVNNLQHPVPQGYAADWNDGVHNVVALDVQAMGDLAAGRPRAIDPRVRGLYETFVTSSVDGMWIPVAVYVPAGVKARAPLAVVLHGSGESETDVVGQPYFRRLADRTGTILIAPYGRGSSGFRGVAKNDVYDALHAAQHAFSVDETRTYLVGYSMGGFSVFTVGPGYRWSGIMDISGAMADSAIGRVAFAWRTTPVYVVTGTNDIVVPPGYPEHTAKVLTAIGVPASLYEQPDGEHWVRTLFPALSAAWSDMHAGIVRSRSAR